MTLTVPRAGVIGGRAPNAAGMPVAEPIVGSLIADLGDAILQKQAKLREERNQIALQKTNLDIARDLGRARIEVDQINDPDALDQAWQEQSARIYAERVATIADPDLRAKAELDWQAMNDRQSLAVGQNAVTLTQSQRAANWIEMKTQITAEAATADPETFGIYLEQGLAAIDARTDLTPEQAAIERQSLQSDMYASRATQAITADPDAFLAAVESGEYNALGGDALTRFRSSAQAEKTRRAEAAQKAIDVEVAKTDKALSTRFGQITDLASNGLIASDEALLNSPEVQSRIAANPELLVKHAEAQAALALRAEIPGIAQLTPDQLKAAIAAERATPKDQPFQAERVKVLESHLAKAETAWATDGVAAAKRAGLSVPSPVLPDADPANAGALAQALSDRLTFDDWQRSKGYGATQAILSVEETAKLKAVVKPEADVSGKMALAEALAAGAGVRSREVTAVIGTDAVFNRATHILRNTGDRDLAAAILNGQQKEALKNVSVPPLAERQRLFSEVTRGVFDNNPALAAEIMAATNALYADGASATVPDGDLISFKDNDDAQDLYRTSLARITGAQPDRNGQLTIGGLQEVNGAGVVLPAGVAREAVEDAWDKVDIQLRGGVWDDRYKSWSYSGEEADPLRALKSASIDIGAAPALGGDPRRQWLNARPRRVGESDVYELVITRNGRELPVPIEGDPAGRAFRFRLKPLIEGAQR